MKYNSFPGTEERISAMGLGTWVFGGENWGGADDTQCLRAIERGLELGVNFIDTAPFYSDGLSEKLIGYAIRGKSNKVFVATKCGLIRDGGRVRIDLSPYSIFKEFDQSRMRLERDYIDLYQCHWPDVNTPVEKTMEVLVKLQKESKIKHIGVCNYSLELLSKALKVAPVKSLQMQYSLLDRSIEKDLVPFCIEHGVAIIAYGPLGGGILTGKYEKPPQLPKGDARSMFYKYYAGVKFDTVRSGLNRLKEVGKPLNQLALNWVRQQRGVMTVLAGCRTPEQVAANAAAFEWDLSLQDMDQLRSIDF